MLPVKPPTPAEWPLRVSRCVRMHRKISWTREEVDQKLKEIMQSIHAQCVKYGTQPDGYVNYVKGANVAGFIKVARAIMDQGIL